MDDEAEETLWFIKTGDSKVGPVSITEIQAMLKTGELSARTQARRNDEMERVRIGEHREIFCQVLPFSCVPQCSVLSRVNRR